MYGEMPPIKSLPTHLLVTMWQVFSGYHEAYSAGARGKTLVLYVLSRAKSSAFSFGAWIGSYSGSKCAFITLRDGKRDALNGT